MADKKSVKLLPGYLQTDRNSKFLSSTLDQLIKTPEITRIDGYIGSRLSPNYNPATDFYVEQTLGLRKKYPLEPALVFSNPYSEVTDVISYDDIINEIGIQGGKTDNLDKLFRSDFYSYDPLIDWDKLINYDRYYWLSTGPQSILIDVPALDVDTAIVGSTEYTLGYRNKASGEFYKLSNGMALVFRDDVIPAYYRDKTFIVEGVGNSIKLIDIELLEANEAIGNSYNETFDTSSFDNFPFDGDLRTPTVPSYIAINRASRDLNPWTRYNRWFHTDIIAISAEINEVSPVYPLSLRARRPIIEFIPNIQLFNFGKNGIQNVDIIDTDTTDAFTAVDGQYGYYSDGRMLENGQRIIFNADLNESVRENVYRVTFDNSGSSPVIRLLEEELANSGDAVAVNTGDAYSGTSWYYDGSTAKWVFAQQYTVLNQAPLFELYDNNGISYTDPNSGTFNTFFGNKIFGYDVGTGTNDAVLGFPLKYENSVGVGSYLFKNFFMTDTITIASSVPSTVISTGITFLRINNDDGSVTPTNVWKTAVDYKIPVIETQTVTEVTDSLVVSCFDYPVDTNVEITVYIRPAGQGSWKFIESSVSFTKQIHVNFNSNLSPGDVVMFRIIGNQVPNDNGYYETPLSLTNNPLNGPISNMTLSELSDHAMSMVSRNTAFTGIFPGLGNLRDLTDYTKYGTKMIINASPMAFAQLFLGKKEHNVVDALRLAADQYNQFKMNLLQGIVSIDEQLSPSDALDEVLRIINISKDVKTPYYYSDMIGYGADKIEKNYIIENVNQNTFSISGEFSLSKLSFKSLLLYINDSQLTVDIDYSIDDIDSTVTILHALAVGDTLTIRQYSDTRGAFVPATPSKLGLYPKYAPKIYIDDSYADNAYTVIQGHDGSIMRAYGDYRDQIILEFEKRVYNNIKIFYDSTKFDINAVLPGAFRNNKYSREDALRTFRKDFLKWAGVYNIDIYANNTFDEGNPFTWNFTGGIDVLFDETTFGSWRALYNYFFDTDKPHTHPWEMLGLSSKPDWWDTEYGSAPYTSQKLLMWQDLEGGYNRGLGKVISEYTRRGLLNIIPVDGNGNLKSPTEFLVSGNSYADKKTTWKIGDFGPAETAWRKSSYWPFALNIATALLDPVAYTSKSFDLSRTSINSAGQFTYLTDLYLNPSRLILDMENDQQTAGFGVYVVEKGKQTDQNYSLTLRQDLDYLTFNLFHKLGGFASKDKLQISIDSVDPTSLGSGVVLPLEDYSLILNTSNPIKSASISGVIVQKINGKFVVKGYDKTNPYFEVLSPFKVSGTVTVGGVSSPFTEWTNTVNNGNSGLNSVELTSVEPTTTRYYKQGQIVRYNNRYYIVKVGHNAQPVFDPALFQLLPTLPMTGGATVQIPASFGNTVTQVPYGTEFSTIQAVYDLLVGYGAFLETQGFIFDNFNAELNEILDWKFTGKEFLYWTTQNWANNSLITLSPFANQLKYSLANSTVDNISFGKYEYSLLKADGKSFPISNFNLSREDGVCTIETENTEEGLFFATLNSIQKEHGIVFRNTTIFNDTLYDIETGSRQLRVKLSGFKTRDWNGDLSSPGFIYDSVEITDWAPYKIYQPGALVRYNGAYYESILKVSGDAIFDFAKWVKLSDKPVSSLLPNFDYRINQFEDFYSLDIDNFDYSQQQLAQHLIGYTPRPYLDNIFSNDITQYKFYQGFIKEKGTKNAIDRISKASVYNKQGSIDFKEEWAFRIGHYGSYGSFDEIEFALEEGTFLENPYLVKFVDQLPELPNELTNYITPGELLLTPDAYSSLSTFNTIPSDFENNNLELTTAGFVKPSDVTVTAYNKNSLLDIANNSLLNEGDTIWLGFLENGSWTVYRYTNQIAKISGVYVSSPASEITFVTSAKHGLSVGDIVSVVRFNEQVNGVYVVQTIPESRQFTVASTLSTIVDDDLLAVGSLFKFKEVRYNSIDSLASDPTLYSFSLGSKVWVDVGPDQKWIVYEKINNYDLGRLYTLTDTPTNNNKNFGYTVHTSEDSSVVMVSAPNWRVASSVSLGRIVVYDKIQGLIEKQFEYNLNDIINGYCDSKAPTDFGYSLAYDNNKQLYFASAPAASVVKKSQVGNLYISTTTGVISAATNEGLVKISARVLGQESTVLVLSNPGPATSNARFGNSIYVNQVSESTPTLLLVGAPGAGGFDSTTFDNNTTTFDNGDTRIGNVVDGQGLVYSYVINAAKVVTATEIVSSPSFDDKFGTHIVGTIAGDIIAITSYSFVEIYNLNLVHQQTITPTYGVGTVSMSESGKYLFISAETYGTVSVYKNINGTFVLDQTIVNPVQYIDLRFGYSVSLSKDESTLLISALGTNRSNLTTFDGNSTVFDGKSTRFNSAIRDSGTVYVYNNLGSRFVQAGEIIDPYDYAGSRFGHSVVATDRSLFVGAPFQSRDLSPDDTSDNSGVFQFTKLDDNSGNWKVSSSQPDIVNISEIKRVALIDLVDEEIIDYLDVIDPVKGKVSGLAEQELKYKSAFDPAVYTIGTSLSIVDSSTSWIDDHIGELWWDLSTVKYVWYEQGDDIFRKNNWGRIFPGSSIDVYEWVKSDLLPSEWAAQADTNEGLTRGISGQPKYPDNSVVSVKQLFNTVTGAFENVYYFWVKNKVTVPSAKNRRISSFQVANLIADPAANGVKFAEILSENSVAFTNVQPILVGNNISVNIVIDTNTLDIPRHTEWILLEEGSTSGMQVELLNKKLFDSLLGHDSFGNAVPALDLTSRNRYGISIRPRQTMFKNRLAALRNIVEYANVELGKNRIVDLYPLDNFEKQETIPDVSLGEYDLIVEDLVTLAGVDTDNFIRAELECFTSNGKLVSVNVINPGFGYSLPPTVTVVSSSGLGAEIKTQIDGLGRVISASVFDAGNNYVESSPTIEVRSHTVVVQANEEYKGLWTMHVYDYSTEEWIRFRTQSYNTSLYKEYIDWTSDNYNAYKDYSFAVSDAAELSDLLGVSIGDYVKINNAGSGRFAILEKIANNRFGTFNSEYDIVFSEKGTVRILDSIWNYGSVNYSYDDATFAETLYDQLPDLELFYILTALKDDIFVDNLRANWSNLFFKAVKYAMTEQKLLDWTFKTSFINVTNSAGDLGQRPVRRLDNESYFEQYVMETKPYRTKIRNFISKYTNETPDTSLVNVTDFDLPSYFDLETQTFETVELGSTLLEQSPWNAWASNYKYQISDIVIGDAGSGYTSRPTVVITTANGDTGTGATAEAHIRNGELYKVEVTNSGTGYIIPPTVEIIGGGEYVTSTARAAAILGNNPIRKNIIGIRFDRVDIVPELSIGQVTETFICTGVDNSIELTWYADEEKINITPLLDGKLIFSADYRIEHYADPNKGYNRMKSKFVFLKIVPAQGQIFKISYNKNISLYTAVDRINEFYHPSDAMPGKELPLLMTGAEYPRTQLQGLPFSYASPFTEVGADWLNDVWEDQISNFATAKLINTATIQDSVLFLDGVNDIIPGQLVNVMNSSTRRIREGTVVESVDFTTNSISLKTSAYRIKKIRASDTIVSSPITVWTSKDFNGNPKNGDIRPGDTIFISNIDNGVIVGFDGTYVVDQILDNDKFSINVVNELSTTTVRTYSTNSQVRVSNILETIEPGPEVEFWKYSHDETGLDTALSAGTWNSQGNLSGALGISPDDLIIDGDAFLTPNSSRAPEECLPGHVTESLGINVYTKADKSYPLSISNVIPVSAGVISRVRVGMALDEVAGLMVHMNGVVFDRVTRADDANDIEFTAVNQYYVAGDTLVVAPQNSAGKLSYTVITIGGDQELDTNVITVENQTEATVSSLASYYDVRKAYVLVDGVEIPEITGDPAEFVGMGYVLTYTNEKNKRAAVTVYNITLGFHTIEAWFFKVPYTEFNRVNEETFGAQGQTEFLLAVPPGKLEPRSSHAIVEVGLDGNTNIRKRLSPPSVSYYEITNNQTTFRVDNKISRPAGSYTDDTVMVYVNGIELSPVYDYYLDTTLSEINLLSNRAKTGDVLAIVGMISGEYDYTIVGNILKLEASVSEDNPTTVKVITFTNHDNMLMRTERFRVGDVSTFTLSKPTINDNFVWVYLNGIPLIARHQYELLDDARTIQIAPSSLEVGDDVMVTTINPPYIGDRIVAYRMFNDILDRTHYKRIAQYHSTTLTKPLSLTDTEIHVADSAKLTTPNAGRNIPGIILVDGERIEFFVKDGNVLSQLRRGTLGTSPAFYSEVGTKVMDQSVQQTVPYSDSTVVQTTATTETTVYSIDTSTIILSTLTNAIDQVSVYYGGRQLRKSSLQVHDSLVSFDNSENSMINVPAEFSIDTNTNEIMLNISGGVISGIELVISQKRGYVWSGTESLITSDVIQAQFLRDKEAVLPDVYYYGGDATLLDESYAPITDEENNPLEGY